MSGFLMAVGMPKEIKFGLSSSRHSGIHFPEHMTATGCLVDG